MSPDVENLNVVYLAPGAVPRVSVAGRKECSDEQLGKNLWGMG